MSNLKPETVVLHGGHVPDPATRSRAVPIYQTTSFVFADTEDAAGLFGTLSAPIDNTMGDFMQGEYTENTTNLPSKPDTPFMGLVWEGAITTTTSKPFPRTSR